MPRLCVFCGSSPGRLPAYGEAADAATDALVAAGWDLVYGGARIGIMGRVADRALAAGAEVHGVIPGFLDARELAHQGLTELHQVESMHERKVRMVELSDAFLALPGGFGTLDELFEVLTLAQLGAHRKPTAVLDTAGYFTPLLRWVDGAVEAGFARAEHRELFVVCQDPAALPEALARHVMPELPGWVRPDQA